VALHTKIRLLRVTLWAVVLCPGCCAQKGSSYQNKKEKKEKAGPGWFRDGTNYNLLTPVGSI
jgi:hypothetical protein